MLSSEENITVSSESGKCNQVLSNPVHMNQGLSNPVQMNRFI